MKKFIKSDYYTTWKSNLTIDIQNEFALLKEKELESHSFTFYTSVSVMTSSRIEGETLDVDSYVKHKLLNIEYLPNLTEKPNDLYKAYLFAKDNKLTQSNFLLVHTFISNHLLPLSQRGVLRSSEMVVLEHDTGRIQYEAAPAKIVNNEFELFWDELDLLLNTKLDVNEVFYYASFIHLSFVNIHPFNDGNGRIARLLEKWFLAEKLGDKAWYIQSEKYYYKEVNNYYKNLARLGVFYDSLNFEKAIPFLLMLPQALITYKNTD